MCEDVLGSLKMCYRGASEVLRLARVVLGSARMH